MAILQVISKNGVALNVHAQVSGRAQARIAQAALQAYARKRDAATLLATGDYWPAGELDVVSMTAFEVAAPARPSLTVISGPTIRTPPRRPHLTLIQGDLS